MGQYILGLLEVICSSTMSYVAAKYFLFIAVTVVIYYLFPKKSRWIVLLFANGYFYYEISGSKRQLLVISASIIVCYLFGRLLEIHSIKSNGIVSKIILALGVIISALPLFATKLGEFIAGSVIHNDNC